MSATFHSFIHGNEGGCKDIIHVVMNVCVLGHAVAQSQVLDTE